MKVRFTKEGLEYGDNFARAWEIVFRHIEQENEWAEELGRLIADEKRKQGSNELNHLIREEQRLRGGTWNDAMDRLIADQREEADDDATEI